MFSLAGIIQLLCCNLRNLHRVNKMDVSERRGSFAATSCQRVVVGWFLPTNIPPLERASLLVQAMEHDQEAAPEKTGAESALLVHLQGTWLSAPAHC